jgi:hypothetical protein
MIVAINLYLLVNKTFVVNHNYPHKLDLTSKMDDVPSYLQVATPNGQGFMCHVPFNVIFSGEFSQNNK